MGRKSDKATNRRSNLSSIPLSQTPTSSDASNPSQASFTQTIGATLRQNTAADNISAKYSLSLMSFLHGSSDNPDAGAEKYTFYIDEHNRNYKVLNDNGEMCTGRLPREVDLNHLNSRLEDLELKKSIVSYALMQGHINESEVEPVEPILIAIWNDKGGVGKTTATYSLGYVLQDLGLRVLMVDVDHQMNLTHLVWPDKFLPPPTPKYTLSLMSKLPGADKTKAKKDRIYIDQSNRGYLVLDQKGKLCEGELPDTINLALKLKDPSLKRKILSYISHTHEDILPKLGIDTFLEEAKREADSERIYLTVSGLFKDVQAPQQLRRDDFLLSMAKKVKLSKVGEQKFREQTYGDYDNLFFLPVGASTDDSGGSYIMKIDEWIRSSIQDASTGYLGYNSYISNIFRAIGRHHRINVILFDMNPYPNYFNQALLIGSNYFLLPCFADFFSVESINTVGKILPHWYQSFHTRDVAIKEGKLPVIENVPKFLGIFPQRIRIYNKNYQQSQAYYIDRLAEALEYLKDKLERFSKDRYPHPEMIKHGLVEYVSMLQMAGNDESTTDFNCRGVLDFASSGLDAQGSGRPLCDFRVLAAHMNPNPDKTKNQIALSAAWNNYRAFLEVVNMAIINFSAEDFQKLPAKFRECIALTRNLRFRIANDQVEPTYAASPFPHYYDTDTESDTACQDISPLFPPDFYYKETYLNQILPLLVEEVKEHRGQFIVCQAIHTTRSLINEAVINALYKVKRLNPQSTPYPIILLPINLGAPQDNSQATNSDLNYWGMLAIRFKPTKKPSNFPFSVQLLVLFDPLGFSQVLRKTDNVDQEANPKNPRNKDIKDICKKGKDSREHVEAVLEQVHKSIDILNCDKPATKGAKGILRQLKSKDDDLKEVIAELTKIPLCCTTCGFFRDTTKNTGIWLVEWVRSLLHHNRNLVRSDIQVNDREKLDILQEHYTILSRKDIRQHTTSIDKMDRSRNTGRANRSESLRSSEPMPQLMPSSQAIPDSLSYSLDEGSTQVQIAKQPPENTGKTVKQKRPMGNTNVSSLEQKSHHSSSSKSQALSSVLPGKGNSKAFTQTVAPSITARKTAPMPPLHEPHTAATDESSKITSGPHNSKKSSQRVYSSSSKQWNPSLFPPSPPQRKKRVHDFESTADSLITRPAKKSKFP